MSTKAYSELTGLGNTTPSLTIRSEWTGLGPFLRRQRRAKVRDPQSAPHPSRGARHPGNTGAPPRVVLPSPCRARGSLHRTNGRKRLCSSVEVVTERRHGTTDVGPAGKVTIRQDGLRVPDGLTGYLLEAAESRSSTTRTRITEEERDTPGGRGKG